MTIAPRTLAIARFFLKFSFFAAIFCCLNGLLALYMDMGDCANANLQLEIIFGMMMLVSMALESVSITRWVREDNAAAQAL